MWCDSVKIGDGTAGGFNNSESPPVPGALTAGYAAATTAHSAPAKAKLAILDVDRDPTFDLHAHTGPGTVPDCDLNLGPKPAQHMPLHMRC